MLKIIVLTFTLVALVATLDWKDCGDKSTKAVTISQFEAPTHINFPGLVHYTVNLTFTRNISQVFMDFDIIRYFLGFPLSLPCSHDTIVGTCTGVNLCEVLNRTLQYMPDHPDSYGQKLQTVMNKTIGHYLACPIKRQTIFVKDNVLELAEIPSYLHLLADGDYTIRLHARENRTGPVIGCIEVNATIGGRDNFGPASLIG